MSPAFIQINTVYKSPYSKLLNENSKPDNENLMEKKVTVKSAKFTSLGNYHVYAIYSIYNI